MQSEALIEKLFQPLIANDETEARQVVSEALAAGVEHESLSREAFLPLLRTINALRRGGQLTGMAHHYAIQLLRALVDESRDGAPVGRQSRQRVFNHPRPSAPRHQRVSQRTPAAAESGRRPPVDQYVSICISNGVLSARPVGPRISEREAGIIATEITDAMDYLGGRLQRFVLDLSDVQTMSSMALGLCIDVQQRARRLGARAVMYGVNRHLAEGLRAMKVDRLYEQARDDRELQRLLAA